MHFFKRISATLFSRVDQVITQMENHDAVIEAAILDTRQAAARAKVRLARVRSDGDGLRARLKGLRREGESWAERARSTAPADEDGAIECLRRRKRRLRQAEEVEKAVGRHREMEEKLSRDIQVADERLAKMSQQRNLMRTRQSAAEALGSLAEADNSLNDGVEDAFERWEISVTEAEMTGQVPLDDDPLEREYLAAEEKEALRGELNALMNKGGRK